MSKKLPDITKKFPEWYQEVIYEAELADHGPVRGSIIIRPYGYAIWEHIKQILDKRIKETGHQNAAFPLLIPLSFIEKEAKHIKGFAPELAIVTRAGGKKLEEPLAIRPTSETIIHHMFSKWIKSWRDLPLKINQWANVVRWELRPRPFLRTSEFFWQEGHTAHETKQEAEDEARLMLDEYINFIENYLAIPIVSGLKSESEKFAGAEKTYTMEGIMPDGKALQMGTSHVLSQDFAKAFDMQYQDREGSLAYPYLTSWGVTTRLIGALVMMHGDEKGLILPPKIAPIQVVIVPIFKTGAEKKEVLKAACDLAQKLKAVARVMVDDDEQSTPGAKFYKWELKGVPMRVEIGPRDIANGTVVVADRLGLAKETIPIGEVDHVVKDRLDMVQRELYDRAEKKVKKLWHKGEKLTEFGKKLEQEGGFYQTGWCRDPKCEQKLKEYKATIRCVLPDKTFHECFACNKPSPSDVLVAKAY